LGNYQKKEQEEENETEASPLLRVSCFITAQPQVEREFDNPKYGRFHSVDPLFWSAAGSTP
jgi:hypothetical protein